MGDHTHFKIPVWGKILSAFGVVDGTREICGKILSRGYLSPSMMCLLFLQLYPRLNILPSHNRQHILVYPGGAREVMKRKTDKKYSLLWESKYGCFRPSSLTIGSPFLFSFYCQIERALRVWRFNITAPSYRSCLLAPRTCLKYSMTSLRYMSSFSLQKL